MTAQDLIINALRRLQVLQPSESPSNEDASFALEILNGLIDGWKLQRLLIASITRTTWTIVSGTATYTLGTGGTINVGRPALPNDLSVSFLDTSTAPDSEYPVRIMTDASYQAIPQKDLTSPFPTAVYYNPTFGVSSTGLGTLTFWPVPTSSTLEGVVYLPTPLAELATLATDFYAPPGYRRLYQTHLTKELAEPFNRPVTQAMIERAEDAMAWVKTANTRLADLGVDLALTQASERGDIYSGQV